MPRKRHHGKYSKPPSTAPQSLVSSGRQSNIHNEEPSSRSVNDLLANLRRAALANAAHAASAPDGGGGSGSGSGHRQQQLLHLGPAAAAAGFGSSAVFPSPSVPPEIAHILLPDVPPAARAAGGGGGGLGGGLPHHHAATAAAANAAGGRHRAAGVDAGAGGEAHRRRGPAGPAPPPSWLAQSRHAPAASRRHRLMSSSSMAPLSSSTREGLAMPGVSLPATGSLVDRALRAMAVKWPVQRHYNQYYLLHLRGPLRAALLSYLGRFSSSSDCGGGGSVSMTDLRALLLPPVLLEGEETTEPDGTTPTPTSLNDDVRYLDLSGAVGRTLSLKELSDLLFPDASAGKQKKKHRKHGPADAHHHESGLLESWDLPGPVAVPRTLLPNLTHLSLALDPSQQHDYSAHSTASTVSWRQLLAFAVHLPMLTHLSLAYWPMPTLTPNARHIEVATTTTTGQSLDNTWAEAVLLVRKLSKALYGLAYLDLTGCAAWSTALVHRVDNNQVDWAGDWGKMTTLVLSYGDGGEDGLDVDGAGDMDGDVHRRSQTTARKVEQHIRRQRAGQGRFITVEYERVKHGEIL